MRFRPLRLPLLRGAVHRRDPLHGSGTKSSPRLDYGAFREGDTTLIVRGGLGESIVPVRFNMPPEIALVTLVPIGEGIITASLCYRDTQDKQD